MREPKEGKAKAGKEVKAGVKAGKEVKAGKKKSPFNNTFIDFTSVKEMTIGQVISSYNKSLKIPIPSISKTIWSLIKDHNLIKK